MARRLFLFVAAMFSCCAKLDEENVNPMKIYASVGETAVLPCQTDIYERLLTVEWSKDGKIALVYRDGRETYQDKDPYYKNRTSLVRKKPVKGNISLRIANVQLSAYGVFICKTIWERVEKVVKVELIVGAVSEPKLSVVPSVDGGVTLQCEANGWFPEPEITFLDDQGNVLKAEEPKNYQNSTGCFTVTRRVTLPAATNRVTCQVHQQQTNQTRATDLQIYIPENFTSSCTASNLIVAALIIFLCGLLFIPVQRKYGICGGCKLAEVLRRSTNRSTAVEIPETDVNSGNQDEVINDKQSPAVNQHHQLPNVNNPKPPTPTNTIPPITNISPQNRYSKPLPTDNTDVQPSSPSASTSEQWHGVHSMSLSRQNKRLSTLSSRSSVDKDPEASKHLLPQDAEI